MTPIPQIRTKHLAGLLAIFVLITLCTFINRFPTGDDAWFAEQSYWLEKDGIIRSEFFRGIVGWERQILVSHKLFLAFGAVIIHFFGYDLPVLKISGLLFFIVLVAQVVFYIYKNSSQDTLKYILAIAILIFTNRLLIKMSFENRPEMMVAALGFGSFLCLNGSNKNRFLFFAGGILAGLSFLTHLNGSIYILAGFVSLCFLRVQAKMILLFLTGVAISSSFYFVDIFSTPNGLEMWWYQFRNDPATQASFAATAKLIQLVTFPRMFFQSPEQLSLSVLLTYLFWAQRGLISLLPRYLRIYSLTLLISFWLISKGNAGMYLVLFIPFMLVLSYELYRLRPITKSHLKWLILAYVFIGVFGSFQIIQKNLSLGYLPKTYQNLEKVLPKASIGIVPLTFFFNEYEKFPSLLTHENYKLYRHKVNMSPDDFGRWAKANKADFILMDYKFNAEKFFPLPSALEIPFYRRSYFDGRFAVFLPIH